MATPSWAANLPASMQWMNSMGRDYGEGTPHFVPPTSEGAEGLWMLGNTGIQNYDPTTNSSWAPVSTPLGKAAQARQRFDLRGNPLDRPEFAWSNPSLGWDGTSAAGESRWAAESPGAGWELRGQPTDSWLTPGELLSFAMQIFGPQFFGAVGTAGETIPGAFEAGNAAAGGSAAATGAGGVDWSNLNTIDVSGQLPAGSFPGQTPPFGGWTVGEKPPLDWDKLSQIDVNGQLPAGSFEGQLPVGVTPNAMSAAALNEGGAFDMFGTQNAPGSMTDMRTIFDQPSFLERVMNSAGISNTGMGGLGLPGGGDVWDEFRKKFKMIPGGGPISTGMAIASGLYGMNRANKTAQIARSAADRADPFAPMRPQFQDQLSKIMLDPSMIQNMPGYKAGLQAVERSGAKQGWLGSGNMMIALNDYGGRFFNDTVKQLADLSGANINPGASGQFMLEGNKQAMDMVSRALASLGYAAGGR